MVKDRSSKKIRILDYEPIYYAFGYSSLLLNYIPLEESITITLVFIFFFGVYKLLSISVVDRCGKMDV